MFSLATKYVCDFEETQCFKKIIITTKTIGRIFTKKTTSIAAATSISSTRDKVNSSSSLEIISTESSTCKMQNMQSAKLYEIINHTRCKIIQGAKYAKFTPARKYSSSAVEMFSREYITTQSVERL